MTRVVHALVRPSGVRQIATTVPFMSIALMAASLVLLLAAKRLSRARERQAESGPSETAYPYRVTGHFLTPAERAFFGVLQQAIGDHAFIFVKPRIADVLKPETGLSRSENASAFNKIKTGHFDFLICDPRHLQPALAIELDDVAHESEQLENTDSFLTQAAAAAGLSLLRISARREYAIAALRDQLAPYLGIATSVLPQSARKPDNAATVENAKNTENTRARDSSDKSDKAKPAKTGKKIESKKPLGMNDATRSEFSGAAGDQSQRYTELLTRLQSKEDIISGNGASECPQCGRGMALRAGEKGALTGKAFWICESYPDCRGMIPAMPHGMSQNLLTHQPQGRLSR